MTVNDIKNIDLDQLDNVTGGTYPRRPDIKLGTQPTASTFVKSISLRSEDTALRSETPRRTP